MADTIAARISRLFTAMGAIEEDDPKQLRATVIETEKGIGFFQDFRGGLSDDELSLQAHAVIHDIANLRDHLRQWAAKNGQQKTRINQTIADSLELRIILDLSNNDKHGYQRSRRGRSGKSPRLTRINRVMQLQTQAKKGSTIAMTLGPGGVPRFIGDGTGKAVVTGDVVDNDNNRIGDLYEIANKAVEAWEHLLTDFGLSTVMDGA